LAAINLSLPFFDEEKIEGTLLNIEELEKHIKLLSIRTSEEILKTFSTVVKGREDVLLGGTLILQQLLLIHKLNKVTVSSRGIRYGAIINFTNNLLKKKNTHQR
jgi:exopolyphosphatase / guanosine-5'-triphosphate,3'-diphosphate pyrophosphatase